MTNRFWKSLRAATFCIVIPVALSTTLGFGAITNAQAPIYHEPKYDAPANQKSKKRLDGADRDCNQGFKEIDGRCIATSIPATTLSSQGWNSGTSICNWQFRRFRFHDLCAETSGFSEGAVSTNVGGAKAPDEGAVSRNVNNVVTASQTRLTEIAIGSPEVRVSANAQERVAVRKNADYAPENASEAYAQDSRKSSIGGWECDEPNRGRNSKCLS